MSASFDDPTDQPTPCDHDHDPELTAPAIRRRERLTADVRRRLKTEREEALAELTELDRQFDELAEKRAQARRAIEQIDEVLQPKFTPWRRRRRTLAGRPPLPATVSHPAPLSGRALRRTALAILRRHGTMCLGDLHGWLHRYGYVVAGRNPVKALADAMGHEHDHGRAVRAERATYCLARERTRRLDRHLDDIRLVDQYLVDADLDLY